MTDQRYNELLNGPLMHPMPMFTISRLARALGYVVGTCGKEGTDALEEFCKMQEMSDRIKAGEDADEDLEAGDATPDEIRRREDQEWSEQNH